METVIQIKPMYWVRLIGGSMYLVGITMMIWNVWQTVRLAPKDLPDPAVVLPPTAGDGGHASPSLATA
jgi:cbb3-type cytochrome oxidase subunit 1